MGVEVAVDTSFGVLVLVGATVALPVEDGVTAPTLMTTVRTAPKCWPLSSTNVHAPDNLPVLLGTVRLTEISAVWPVGTDSARATVCPPIASPKEKTSLKLVVQAHVPEFFTRQVFVKAVLAGICVPSGMVTSETKV